jgi:ATP-binding cassette, subfamily B, bacterial PglK
VRSTIGKISSLLTAKERRRFVSVLSVMVVMGVVQVAGIGSIIPFMALLIDPSMLERNHRLQALYQFLDFGDVKSFTLVVGGAVLFLLVLGNVLAALTTWSSSRFASRLEHRLSVTLLRWFLCQDYVSLTGRNTAEIQRNVLNESMNFTSGIVMPALNLVASVLKVVFIGGFLVWLKPEVTLIAGVVLTFTYMVIYVFVRRPLVRHGKRRMEAYRALLKSIAEAFGSVKEVKLLSLENYFSERFAPHSRTHADTVTLQRILSVAPRYAVEALSFSFVIALFAYLASIGADMQSALPLAGAFILAGYRLLPAFQTVYQSSSVLRFHRPVIDVLYRDLGRGVAYPPENGSKRMSFTGSLRLANLSYTYPQGAAPALKSISLEIPRKAFVSFVGRTGAGKTTLADIVLGLLVPTSGRMSVDGIDITPENVREWQGNVGYVPQEIYLTDESVAANIAFGVPAAMIDRDAVERAARIANIHDFIVGELPQGYETIVGERGVRLSGGQRQRIGLARALYRDPEVLVLDEATSALDKATEQEVHDAIFKAAEAKMLIVIAHRMATIRECDRIFVLENGDLVAEGSYDSLLRSSSEFRRIARESESDVRLETAEKVAVPS